MDGARTSQILSFDTKHDVSLKGIEDPRLKQKEKWTEDDTRSSARVEHDRALQAESKSPRGWREGEGERGLCLDSLNLDLDTEITTKIGLEPLR